MVETQSELPLLQAEGVSVSFGAHAVLRQIDLHVPAGQTLVIIGESGCGKSVLMKTLIGLIDPAVGQVRFDGRDVRTLSRYELPKMRIRCGYLFQQAALFDSMTVAQNIAFPLRRHTKKSSAEVEDVVRGLLREVGLPENALPKKPAELSGGMRKRVGLARALALEPEVMLYDEPTTGLDPIMTDVINQLIIRTRERRHVTSIIVTHNMETVRKAAERVVMLYPLSRLDPDEPQVIYDGPPTGLETAADVRVRQFVRGEAGERIEELATTGA